VIFGIGTDIVNVDRIRRSLARYGERFARRILTPSELEEFGRNGQPVFFLAKRFAAKEAAAKAMGTGFSRGISLRQIGVEREPGRRPGLVFSGTALDYLREQGITASHLSLADEQDHVTAVAVLER